MQPIDFEEFLMIFYYSIDWIVSGFVVSKLINQIQQTRI